MCLRIVLAPLEGPSDTKSDVDGRVLVGSAMSEESWDRDRMKGDTITWSTPTPFVHRLHGYV